VIAASRNDIADGRALIKESIDRLRLLPPEGPQLLVPVARGYGRIPRGDGYRPGLFLEQTFVTARRVKPAGAVAHALCDLAALARDAGEAQDARALAEESLSLFRETGDDLGAAQALCELGNLVSAAGEHELARELHEESLAAREALNDARGIGLSLLAMSVAASFAGEPERAMRCASEALALFDRTDDGPGRSATYMQLGFLTADAGRHAEARELEERAAVLWTAFARNTGWLPPLLIELAELDRALGEPDRAGARIREAIEILTIIGDRAGVARCEELLRAGENAPITID
jgi:tetratricopeptide (TPR) repeat protein